MEPPEKTVNEFVKIYEEVYGEQITYHEAKMMIRRIIPLYRALLRPLPKVEGSEETKPLP